MAFETALAKSSRELADLREATRADRTGISREESAIGSYAWSVRPYSP